jgi:hypothetical protein
MLLIRALKGYMLCNASTADGIMEILLTTSISSSEFLIKDGIFLFDFDTLPGRFGFKNWWMINSQSSFLWGAFFL